MSETRKYDILLLGGTGYTGQMVLEYILKNYSKEIKEGTLTLCCGVRKAEKLKDVIRFIVKQKEHTEIETKREKEIEDEEYSIFEKRIHIHIVDINDYNSIVNVCSKSKVVINMTGPYSIYGYNVVKSCVEANCHYIDATGEHNFILRIIKDFNQTAKEKKIKIIHSASFISAISDLGNFIIQNEHLKKFEKPCQYVRVRLSTEGSKYSTIGKTTITSALLVRKEIGNAYNKHYLCDNKYEESKDLTFLSEKKKSGNSFMDYEEEVGYCFPTIYSEIEEGYVLWSNYLLNYKYGKDFMFDFKKYDPNINALAYIWKKVTGAVTSFIGSFQLCNYVFQKYIDNWYIPKTSNELKKAFWKVTVIGESLIEENSIQNESDSHKPSLNNPKTNKVYLYLSGENEDPGYLLTAKILSESALTLLQNGSENEHYGVTTISVGLGHAVVQRLKKASININLEMF